ncbi:hypothetical protein MAF45_09335 [Mesosutterella sp. OilRF-GAM-744-9]|uniref:Aminomethyltransferase folate-binding domain-containing protein n=1 Tax=Mesosutterella porci TaxID=2915351 RepID=A0ABS9MSN8_9BURK|nr:hypothetical protein [Mesosutterella sp. oilRF-744-WT-GAM-9]MCG5031640.1 hypothetical protein [Mesosutterella sp. oilRF-744-WT-GAM-9]
MTVSGQGTEQKDGFIFKASRDIEAEVLPGAFIRDFAGAGFALTQGEEGRKLLRRLLSADADKFASGEAFRSALLNASGGVMLEARVLAGKNQWLLVFPPEEAGSGQAWMGQVAVAFDAEVERLQGREACWLGGRQAGEALRRAGAEPPRDGAWAGVGGYRSLKVAGFPDFYLLEGEAAECREFRSRLEAQGAVQASDEVWRCARALHCEAAPGEDYDESSSPLECGFEDCVDFSDPSRMFIGRALAEARGRAGARCRLGLLAVNCGLSADELAQSPEITIEGNSQEGGLATTWALTPQGVLALALLPAGTAPGAAALVTVGQKSFPARVLRCGF